MVFGGAELGGGLLAVDEGKLRDGEMFPGYHRACGFEPCQPLAEEGFVDAGDGCETSRGIAVHGGVADGGFAAVAGGEEDGVAQIGKHPDAG